VPPEGLAVDPQAFEAFSKLATDAGVKPDVASAMLKMHADALAAQDFGRVEQATMWAEETRRELGTTFESTIISARRVLDRYGDKDIREALARSGLGNHLAVVRLLSRVGELLD
jgi:hypothetical protein